MPTDPLDDTQHLSLCEVLDRVLNKGAVVVGEVTISVANVDLIYLGLQLVVTSVETMRQSANNSQPLISLNLGVNGQLQCQIPVTPTDSDK